MWYNMPINAQIIKAIQSISSPFLDNLFQGITMLGEEYFFIIAMTLIYWCIDKRLGYKIGFACLPSNVVNGCIKNILKVPRPIGETGIRSLRIETATGYSFPSGHTQGASTFWAAIMTNFRRAWIYIIGIVLIIAVGISRLYLGVHRPVDVLAGIILGFLWVFISNWMFDVSERTGDNRIFLLFIIPMLIGLYYLKYPDYYKSSGTVLGFYLGYVLESRYINFDVKTDKLKQILKYIVGIAILIAIKVFAKKLLPQSIGWDFFRYMLMGLWVTIGAPIIFKIFFKSKRKNLRAKLINSIKG